MMKIKNHELYLQGENDDKIIGVCADDPEFRHYKDINDLPPHRLAEIRRFFEDCILIICIRLKINYILLGNGLIGKFLDLNGNIKTRRTRTRRLKWKTSWLLSRQPMLSSTQCQYYTHSSSIYPRFLFIKILTN